jgi:hypothetical protein
LARKLFNLNYSEFNELLTKLDGVGGDLKSVVADALEQTAETVEDDTKEAMAKSNMPAGGKYSTGKTEKTIVENARVSWSGTIAEIGIGFDFDKPGAAGFLITGTPRMQPNYALQKIYKRKKYMKDIQQDMADIVMDEIDKKIGGS